MTNYLSQYTFRNVISMIRNNRKDPEICEDDFNDKLVVITGTTSGIGYHTAKEFASHGADLIIINRNQEKSKELCTEIRNEFGVECDYLLADYTHLSDVKRVAQELIDLNRTVDVFIHNAGVYLTKRELTDDGNEKVFQVNYLASFLLTNLLKQKFLDQDQGRIIYVNSEGHRFAINGLRMNDLNWEKRRFTGLKGYGAAKTAQLLSIIKYKEYYEKANVTIIAMHPGNVKTPMGEIERNGKWYLFIKRNFINRSARTPEISAKALYYLGVSKDIEGKSGKFFNLTTEEEPAPPARDEEAADELWDISIKLVGLE